MQVNPNMIFRNRKNIVENVKQGKKLDNWKSLVTLETYMQVK